MAITARSGPDLTFGSLVSGSTNGVTGTATTGGYNDQRAPDVSDLGYSMMDPRAFYQYQPGTGVLTSTYANFAADDVAVFFNSRGFYDFVPVAISSIAIVSVTASSSLASASLTLQAASSARGTYAISITAPETGQIVTSLLTPDSSGTQFVGFGQSGTIQAWSPSFGPGRTVAISPSSYLDSPVTIVGRDVYGYKITEAVGISSIGNTITSSFGGISQKAFKFISAVYHASTPTSTGIAVGFADQFGLPFYAGYASADIAIRISSAVLNSSFPVALSSATFSIGSSRATQTSTTPDVRGLYISSVALTTNYRVMISVTPTASAAAAMTAADMSPLFGAMQFSSV